MSRTWQRTVESINREEEGEMGTPWSDETYRKGRSGGIASKTTVFLVDCTHVNGLKLDWTIGTIDLLQKLNQSLIPNSCPLQTQIY